MRTDGVADRAQDDKSGGVDFEVNVISVRLLAMAWKSLHVFVHIKKFDGAPG